MPSDDTIDWQATIAANSAIASEGRILFNNGTTNPLERVLFTSSGAMTVTWVLKNGTQEEQTYKIGATSSSRPYRIFATRAEEANTAAYIDLSGKFVRFFGSSSLLSTEWQEKAGGVSMGKKVVSTRKGDMLYIHFLDPAVKEFAFLLGGKKTTVKCERAEGDVSDIVVRFPLGGKEPAQYVEPGSRQMWKVVGQTCKNPGNAKAAIDGSLTSLWHTHPEPMTQNAPLPPPQSFTVDCGAVREMSGFTYTPRPEGCSVGVVDKCEFWVSLDGKDWTKAAEGSFPDVLESRKTREVKFEKPVKARYFRFVATHALPVNDRLAVAEVDVM